MPIIGKVCALALASLSLGSAKPDYTIVAYPAVVQVRCGMGSGSAFRVGRTAYLSVAHVTSLGGCKVEGVPVEVIHTDGDLDFSMFRLPAKPGKGLRVNCSGIRRNDVLTAIGYAGGLPFQRLLVERGTGVMVPLMGAKHPMAILVGPEFIPGMSGGPVLNARGEAVGMVNGFMPGGGISFSREIKDTILCQAL